ncbi:hypothetical protein [Corynebacterium mayonis]|uniref:hypothetical protein n=1 Tax=Corynebacterium mayonis TaxID=3062461 RepID=UPI00314061E9
MKLRRSTTIGLLAALILTHTVTQHASAETLHAGNIRYDLPDGYSTSSHPSSPLNAAKDSINGALTSLVTFRWWVQSAPQRAKAQGDYLIASAQAASLAAITTVQTIGRNISTATQETAAHADATLHDLLR